MVLIIDDKSKDEVLDKIMDNIILLQNQYLKDWHWLGPEKRAEIRETISKHTMNYNTIVVKRANKAQRNLLPSLYQPGPQPLSEKIALLELIDST